MRSGAVEIHRRGGELHNRLAEGDIFGQAGLLRGNKVRLGADTLAACPELKLILVSATGTNNTGSYVYDAFGRQTTLPAADAPNPTAGDVTLAYYDSDLPRSHTQAGTTTTWTLDSQSRRSVETTTTAASPRLSAWWPMAIGMPCFFSPSTT